MSSFPLPTLNAIVDAEAAVRVGFSVERLAAAFLDGGARFLQLRAKTFAGAQLIAAARSVVSLAHDRGAIVVVNDRADIARLADADGVHLGQDDLPPEAARRLLGGAAIIGRSTHTLNQLERAVQEPVDYIAIGPVFGTSTKETGYEPVGLDMVRRAATFGRPVVAIGGITLERAPSVIGAGAASVAVIGDLLTGGDPAARVRSYVERLSSV